MKLSTRPPRGNALPPRRGMGRRDHGSWSFRRGEDRHAQVRAPAVAGRRSSGPITAPTVVIFEGSNHGSQRVGCAVLGGEQRLVSLLRA